MGNVTLLQEEDPTERLHIVEEEPIQAKELTAVPQADILAVLHALAEVLAVRFILCLGLLGAIGLDLLAMVKGSVSILFAAGSFDALLLIPLVILAWRKG